MPNPLCVAGKDSKYKQPGAPQAGFLAGLWHGLIAPLSFLVSLFNDNVSVWETANKGKLYELGFLLGIGAFSSRL
ncbi:MAG TPA: hypothetical protein PLL10_01390 [Elusimicrobiales bacterium]|nr:hypothetical protein [Elusimicrobiales bacterium]